MLRFFCQGRARYALWQPLAGGALRWIFWCSRFDSYASESFMFDAQSTFCLPFHLWFEPFWSICCATFGNRYGTVAREMTCISDLWSDHLGILSGKKRHGTPKNIGKRKHRPWIPWVFLGFFLSPGRINDCISFSFGRWSFVQIRPCARGTAQFRHVLFLHLLLNLILITSSYGNIFVFHIVPSITIKYDKSGLEGMKPKSLNLQSCEWPRTNLLSIPIPGFFFGEDIMDVAFAFCVGWPQGGRLSISFFWATWKIWLLWLCKNPKQEKGHGAPEVDFADFHNFL